MKKSIVLMLIVSALAIPSVLEAVDTCWCTPLASGGCMICFEPGGYCYGYSISCESFGCWSMCSSKSESSEFAD